MLHLIRTRIWSWRAVKHTPVLASWNPLCCHFRLQCRPQPLTTRAFDEGRDSEERLVVQKDQEKQGADSKPEQGGQKQGSWRPKKRLTRYQMDHLRALRQEDPDTWTISKLSEVFCVSPVAVKRIMRSKFEPSREVQARQDAKALQQREERRQKFKLQQTAQTTCTDKSEQ